MDPVNAPDQPTHRTIITGLCLAIALWLCLPGCNRQSPTAGQSSPQQRPEQILIFTSPEMEPIIRAAEQVAQRQDRNWQIDLQIGGARTLAWTIEDGEVPDLYIASTIAIAKELLPKPIAITPWLRDQMVVLARADDPDPILHSKRALERSTGAIAVGDDGTHLGDYARLAMRYAEIWILVEPRTTHRPTRERILTALRQGDADLAVVFASDAAHAGPGFSISQTLELPERARIVYTRAAYTDLGAEFADLLDSPEAMELAQQNGLIPFVADPNPAD